MPPLRSLTVAAAGLALIWGSWQFCTGFCGDASGPAAPPASDATDRAVPGVVVLCIDTLRADALALDSGRPVRMPRLEAFAKEAVVFGDAIAHAAWTGPSMTTLLTGLDPGHTGVLGVPENFREPPASIATLGEHCANAGWYTAAVTNGTWFELGRGAMRGIRSGVVGLDGDPTAALTAIDAKRPRNTPFLYVLHSSGAHEPYYEAGTHSRVRPELSDADARFVRDANDRFEPGASRYAAADLGRLMELWAESRAARAGIESIVGAQRLERLGWQVRAWLDDGCERDPDLRARGDRLRVAYERSLPFVDDLFGRVLAAIDGLRLPQGTAIVVVSDHGEAFGEHGTYLHGRRLEDEMLRVPLLVRGAAAFGAPRIVRGDAGLVDVLPTILDLARLPLPSGLDGVSLLAAVAALPDRRAALPERVLRAFDERRRTTGAVTTIERLTALRSSRAKSILRHDRVTGALLEELCYDLVRDPGEQDGVRVPLVVTTGVPIEAKATRDPSFGRRAPN